MLVIHETAFEPLYQSVLRMVEDVAQVHLDYAGPHPEVDINLSIAMEAEWDEDDWSAECWLSSTEDKEANPFGFYYIFADRLEYISTGGKTAFWNALRLDVKSWLNGHVDIVDQYGDPVSLDRADAIVRGARP